MSKLAIDGGAPVRTKTLPYARHDVTDADVAAVSEALRSDWLTTGPRVAAFERAIADSIGGVHVAAVNNGTSALHAAYAALGIGPGDEVILPALTFVATANAARYLGATPVFADVDAHTLLLDPASVAQRVSTKTRAIVGVDYAGQPCDYAALRAIAKGRSIAIVADACHALGGVDEHGAKVGAIADVSTFSFHPAKHVTAGEGGAVTSADAALVGRVRTFRNHGITTDAREREARGAFTYDLVELGYNLRIADFQCALGISQLTRLRQNVARRRAIARRYQDALASLPAFAPVAVREGVQHAFHLFVVRVDRRHLTRSRDDVIRALRAEGIGATLHYPAVHLQPYYTRTLDTKRGDCPEAERAADEIVSLPMFPSMTDRDVDDVIAALTKIAKAYAA